MADNRENEIKVLLERLQEINDRNDYDGLLEQEVSPATDSNDTVPTLGKTEQPMTPMLRARYRYAGRWVNAAASHTWLDLNEMNAAASDRNLRKQIDIRAENWPGSAPAVIPWEQLSLFGVDAEEYQESYLVWQVVDAEPEVWVYTDAEEKRFGNLAEYLKYLTAE